LSPQHFLKPIIVSLDSPHPLLDRAELNSVFSNFIDIWNLHRSFFSSLAEHLHPSSSANVPDPPPPLSPILLSHFPYLSLYTPFVTSFHTSVTSLTGLLTSNVPFSSFVAKQEADPRCGKLKLRDWLLTIVQRCPRYLLLLKDLIKCTDAEDPECDSLMRVHGLVSKSKTDPSYLTNIAKLSTVTGSLNTSLHTHAQALSLLALQRSTPNLPFQLIAPCRTFLKRGTLLQLEGSSFPRERDFLLFSDCLIWLANLDKGDGELADRWDWISGGGGMGKGRPAGQLGMLRSRSRSEAELSAVRERMRSSAFHASHIRPSTSNRLNGSIAAQSKKKRQASGGTGEEKWWFKGRAELVDLEVVVSPPTEPGEDMRFEVLSPEMSFAVYAGKVWSPV
jgi:FYVE, RhoGEF and PH domain containing 5/6